MPCPPPCSSLVANSAATAASTVGSASLTRGVARAAAARWRDTGNEPDDEAEGENEVDGDGEVEGGSGRVADEGDVTEAVAAEDEGAGEAGGGEGLETVGAALGVAHGGSAPLAAATPTLSLTLSGRSEGSIHGSTPARNESRWDERIASQSTCGGRGGRGGN